MPDSGAEVSATTPVEAAQQLASAAGSLAAQAERDRRLDEDLVARLTAAGLFRLCVPEAIGGLEAHPAVLVEAVESLARGDAAPAWCVAVCATSGLVAAYLPEDAAREIYGPSASIVGGVFAPRGRAVAAGDEYRVSGRWPFASGCRHCDWLMGGCLVDDGAGGVRTLQNGMPDVRLMLAPAGEVTIHDTWEVSGLRGTGSEDIELADVAIPAARSASVFTDRPLHDGPLYAFPLFGLLAIAIAGVTLGIARGALDDLVALAGAKRPTGSRRTLGERGTVQAEAGRCEAALRAARAGLYAAIECAWDAAASGGEVPVAERAGLRLAATHAAATASEISHSAFRLGGGTAIYDSSPLQRRFRDASAATAHMLVAPATWELTGRLVLGLETDASQL
jgi:alkylation response protein AidB-like acyl-CoA dehydrogenase